MSTFDDSPQTSRRLVIVLLVASIVLAFALVVLIVLLLTLGSNNASPDSAGTPEPTSSTSNTDAPGDDEPPTNSPATPSATPTTPSNPVRAIAGYTVSATLVDCASATSVPVTFSWTTEADSITFGIGTDRADAQPYETGLDPIGSITVDYQCGQPSAQQIYGIAAIVDGAVVDRAVLAVRE